MIAATVSAVLRCLGAERAEGWLDTWPAFLLLCLAAITPLLAVDFPPLVDIYGHFGRYALQTDLANRPELQPYFSYEWRLIGNLGADLLVEVLHASLGLEAAVRFVVIVTQLLAVAGILLVSRELHGRITPFAIAALPLIYGLPFNYGFLNFSLSMALGLLAFVLWMRLQRSGRGIASCVWLAAAGLIIWVCHTYGWAFLGLLCGSSLLAQLLATKERPLASLKHILSACWPLLLPLVPMIAWRSGSGGLDLLASNFSFKLQWLVSVFRNKWVSFDVASLICVVLLIYWAIRNKQVAFDWRLSISALMCFASFLVLPLQVFGSMFADMRLAPYVLITALLAISPSKLDVKTLRMLSLMAIAFFAVRMLLTGAAYVAHHKAVAVVLPTISAIPKGSRVAFFSVVPCNATWELPILSHMGSIALARRNVFTNNHWQAAGANPLVVHYPEAAPFEYDPSQFVHAGDCKRPIYPTLSGVLEEFPHPAFSHVWVVGPLPDPLIVPSGLEPVPHLGKGALYLVKNSR